MLCLWVLLLHEQMDLLCAMLIGVSLLLIAVKNKASAAIMTIGYLTIMGDIRRMVAASFGQPKLDLLLLVGPVVALTLAAPTLVGLRLKDRMSKAMLLLLVIMVLEIFNPQQGGVTVGISGALFYIAPVLWFWVGRRFASPAVVGRLLYHCIFPLALLAACLGIFQNFVGFLPYQQAWINLASKTYTSLHVGGSIRAFGFSVSGAEYATLLTFGAAGTAAAYFGSKRLWAFACPILVVAVVLASARTLVIKLIFTLAIVWTVREGKKLGSRALLRLGVFTVGGLSFVFVIASHFSSGSGPSYEKGAAVQNALVHQAGGLAHPLDQRYSTAGTHGKMIASGVMQGIVNPIGRGLGATTQASRKFGGDGSTGSSEIDFSDMFISLGLVGGLTYLFVIFEGARYAISYVQKVQRSIALPTLAILTSTVTAWLIGGQYSTSSMVFFLIGALVYEDNLTSVSNPRRVSERVFTSELAVPSFQ